MKDVTRKVTHVQQQQDGVQKFSLDFRLFPCLNWDIYDFNLAIGCGWLVLR